MSNLDFNYHLKTIVDFAENGGYPEVRTEQIFDTLKEAQHAFELELNLEFAEPGKICEVVLWKKYDDAEDEILFSDFKKSALLPKNAVVVCFEHKKYMHYAYEITELRESYIGETYKDLKPNDDQTNVEWNYVFENFNEFLEAYKSKSSAPFNKIAGSENIVKDFILEQKTVNYYA